jgi:hypothetical protein
MTTTAQGTPCGDMVAESIDTRKRIEIKNIGTIKELVFDLPEGAGGVLVLKGRNKIGKSTAIRVLRALLSGKNPGLAVRDKAVRGSAEAFGKRASVGGTVRFTGDLQVDSLEGKFDFSDLVHPEAKDPETRDRIRIKALLSLCGAEPDPSIFYDLVGGQAEFEKLIPAESIKKKDLVELAGMVHRAIHSRAKEKESEAEFARGHAQACKEAAGEAATTETVELTPLHAASSRAAAEVAQIKEQQNQGDETRQRIQSTKAAIEQARQNYRGPSMERACFEYQDAAHGWTAAKNRLDEAHAQLNKAQLEANAAKAALDLKQSEHAAAQQHQAAIESMQKMLAEAEASLAGEPSSKELSDAAQRAEKARADLERGIQLRDAGMKLVEARGHQDKADAAAKEAERLREAARSVDQKLSEKLPVGPLRAEAGRLVLDTERGDGALLDECSAGEKWTIALPYGIKAVGEGGVLAVVQEAWDGLDDGNRQLLADKAKGGAVWIITAEVDNGDLRSEVFAVEEP